MPHSFASTWEKIKRAEDNIQDLNREIDAFLNEPPYGGYRIVYHHQPDSLQKLHELVLPREIPRRFSIRAGEVIYNLRSALDHLAWQLVKAARNEPSERTAFPIFLTSPFGPPFNEQERARFEASVKGMSPWAQTLVKRLQPYRTGNVPQNEPLAVLNSMCNRDKHRELLIVLTAIESTTKFLVLRPTDAVQMYGKQTVHIAFTEFGSSEYKPVIPGLTELAEATSEVVALFVGQFPEM